MQWQIQVRSTEFAPRSPAQGKKLMTLKHGLGNATAGDPVREPPRAPDHWEHAVTVNGLV